MLPNLSEDKKEEEKKKEKRGRFLFSLDKLGSAWVTTFSVPFTTLALVYDFHKFHVYLLDGIFIAWLLLSTFLQENNVAFQTFFKDWS